MLWWSLAALLLAAAVAAAVLLLSPAAKVTVPEVTGQSEQSATATLRRAGLSAVPTLHTSSTVPSGRVVSQSPHAGARVEKGGQVAIVVSGGPASAFVTDVEGLSSSEAIAKLRKAGFKTATKTEASSTVASGKVIGTDPPAGTEKQLGSTVTVIVSSGPAPVKVPDLKGQQLSAAEATLTNAGLEVGSITKRTSASESPGTVLSQSPATGTSVKAGSQVTLVVAEASSEATVPDVLGESSSLAAGDLRAAGFRVETAHAAAGEPSQAGLVLRQSPSPGTKAPKGSTVTITVGEAASQTNTTPTTPTTTTTPTPPASPGA
jgi:serine/threonine-protein kinase